MLRKSVPSSRLADYEPFSHLTDVQRIFLSQFLEMKSLSPGQKILLDSGNGAFEIFLFSGRVKVESHISERVSVSAVDSLNRSGLISSFSSANSIIAESPAEYFTVSSEHMNYLRKGVKQEYIASPEILASMNKHPMVLAFFRELQKGQILLPSLPELASQISQAVTRKDLHLQDMSRLIASDPNLSASLLKMVNSPFYRGMNEITCIPDAVTRLGLDVTNTLVLAFAARYNDASHPVWVKKRLLNSWKESVQMAAFCYVLAIHCGGLSSEEALLTGLLHNIGELPLLDYAAQHPELEHDTEELDAIIRDFRCYVGSIILREWNLPEALITAVQHCDTLVFEPYEQTPVLTDLIIVARAYHERYSPHSDSNELPPDLEKIPSYFKLCQLKGAKIPEDVLDSAQEQIRIVKELLKSPE